MTRTDCVDITLCTNGVLTYDEIGGHLRLAGTGPVEIDLTRLRFIDPAGLVSLAIVAERATLLHRPVHFRKPEGGDVANYLTRMRLGEQLSGLDVVHDLPQVRERRLGHLLVEPRRFEDRKRVVQGKRVDPRGRRLFKKKRLQSLLSASSSIVR